MIKLKRKRESRVFLLGCLGCDFLAEVTLAELVRLSKRKLKVPGSVVACCQDCGFEHEVAFSMTALCPVCGEYALVVVGSREA